MRECVQDVYDVPGLARSCGRRTRARCGSSRSSHPRRRRSPAPCSSATSPQFLYEGDSPLAERRAAALTLDATLLSELLGQAELRDLLDPDALAQAEVELQRLVPERHARDAEGVADLLRMLGPLTRAGLAERGAKPEWVDALVAARRAIEVRVGGELKVSRGHQKCQ